MLNSTKGSILNTFDQKVLIDFPTGVNGKNMFCNKWSHYSVMDPEKAFYKENLTASVKPKKSHLR